MFGKHRKRQHTDFVEPDLPITPMLDMTFQLLAFFIFTFKPQDSEGKIALTLPEEKGGGDGIPDPTSDEPKPIVIVVTVRSAENGKIASMEMRIEDKNAQAGVAQPAEGLGASPDALKQKLTSKYSEYKAANQPSKLQFEISEDLAWAYAVQLIDIGKQIGFTDVAPTVLPKNQD